MTNTTIHEAIINIEKTSSALETYANDPRNYNTEYASILDVMAFEMRKQASSLKEWQYFLGAYHG